MPHRKTRKTFKTQPLMDKAAELAFAVPQVVAHRMTRMALAGASPSARDREEFELMSAEKKAAFSESWNAMASQALKAHQTLTLSFWRSLWSPSFADKPTASAVITQWRDAAVGVLGKGMAPVHSRAVANAKRLGRTKLR